MATKKKKAVKKAVKKVVKKTAAKKPVKKVIKKSAPKKNKVVQKTKTTVQPKLKAAKLSPVVKVDYSKAITPLEDRLVVRLINAERMTPGGLIIPDTATSIAEGYLKATVLVAGQGSMNKKGSVRPLDVKVGDIILFWEDAGTKVKFNSEDLLIIHEYDVMGILQN
ncbi:co-chaperone GroES [bacterium]|nr:co-chaperone GroES [bacterium]